MQKIKKRVAARNAAIPRVLGGEIARFILRKRTPNRHFSRYFNIFHSFFVIFSDFLWKNCKKIEKFEKN